MDFKNHLKQAIMNENFNVNEVNYRRRKFFRLL